jgi:hypothetical protein
VVVLEALARLPQPQSQRTRSVNRLCVVNTHLYSNHTRPAIKLWQTIALLKEIEPFILSQDMALVVCGDFNSEPGSAVYQYLSHGAVDDQSGHLLEEVAKVSPPSLRLTPFSPHLCLTRIWRMWTTSVTASSWSRRCCAPSAWSPSSRTTRGASREPSTTFGEPPSLAPLSRLAKVYSLSLEDDGREYSPHRRGRGRPL